MTGREKIEAAFSTDGTPQIPAVICYDSILFRDHFSEISDQPWWTQQSGDMTMHMALNRDRLKNIPQDWINLPSGSSYYERENIRIEERADGVYRVDAVSGKEQKLEQPRVSGNFIDIGKNRPSPRSREEIEAQITIPAREDMFKFFEDGRNELAEELLKSDAKERFPMVSTNSSLWGCINTWTFEELMEMAATDIDLVEYACELRTERAVMGAEVAARRGAKGVWIEECMTDMVSPTFYRRLNLPGLKRIIEAYQDAGVHTILYYCGNPDDRLEMLLESGADALAFEEGKKGFEIDIEKIAERIDGRAALLGNLDAINLLERGSDDELRFEIGRQISAGRRNKSRFIMSLGSPVTPGTSMERVRRYLDIAHELGG